MWLLPCTESESSACLWSWARRRHLRLTVTDAPPLHTAASFQPVHGMFCRAGTIRALFAAVPDAARLYNSDGRTALELLLVDTDLNATARDLGVRNPQATLQLLRACRQHSDPALPTYLAACLPLSSFEWASLPAACLAASLPAVVAHSSAQARLLAAHLPTQDAARLRTLALCMARMQREIDAPLPMPLLQRILVQAGSLLYEHA